MGVYARDASQEMANAELRVLTRSGADGEMELESWVKALW